VEEGTPTHDNLSQPLSVDGPGIGSTESEGVDTSPFEKFDPLLHIGVSGASTRTRSGKEKKKEVLSIAFVKKYIQYAKGKPAPVLTKGAADWIVNLYASLRNDEGESNQKKVRCGGFWSCVHVDNICIVDLTPYRTYVGDAHTFIHCTCQSTIIHKSTATRCDGS